MVVGGGKGGMALTLEIITFGPVDLVLKLFAQAGCTVHGLVQLHESVIHNLELDTQLLCK